MGGQSERFQGKIVVGVVAVVSDPECRVLFVAQQKGPYAGHWLLPGGGVEPGESARDAIIREIREETSFTMGHVRYVGAYELRGAWAGGNYHLLMLAFAGQAEGEIPHDFQGDGVGEVRWAHVHELPLHCTDLRILTDAGVAHFAEDAVNAALQQDGVSMEVYRS